MSFGRRSRFAPRAGFTLVELLVVISIIGMLMALLFPAINSARENGRQTTCRNNMRSVVTALHAYESKQNRYPSFMNISGSATNPLMHELLPEFERQDLYRSFNNGYGNDPTAAGYPTAFLEFLQCPSNVRGTGGAVNCFVYNAGTYGVVNSEDTVELDGDPVGHFVSTVTFPLNVKERHLGMFYQVGASSAADLTGGDGAMNTLLVSENLNAGDWNLKTEAHIGFTWELPNTPSDPTLLHGINRRKTEAGFAPTSNHPLLVNVAFADSHVRTLTENLDYFVYVQLCTPNGAAAGLRPLTEEF